MEQGELLTRLYQMPLMKQFHEVTVSLIEALAESPLGRSRSGRRLLQVYKDYLFRLTVSYLTGADMEETALNRPVIYRNVYTAPLSGPLDNKILEAVPPEALQDTVWSTIQADRVQPGTYIIDITFRSPETEQSLPHWVIFRSQDNSARCQVQPVGASRVYDEHFLVMPLALVKIKKWYGWPRPVNLSLILIHSRLLEIANLSMVSCRP